MASALDPVTRGFITQHPAAAARTLARLDGRDVEAIFAVMPRALAARVLEHMAPGTASRCLLQLPADTAAEILARSQVLAAVAALRVMKPQQVQTLVNLMPRATAARLRLRLRFSESVIGAFVDEDVMTLSPEHRVSDALRLFRRSGQHTGQTIPVLDQDRRLLGIADLCELLGASDRRLVQHLTHPARVVLNARAALQTVNNHPAWLSHDSLPVVNRYGIFQGVLRRARVMEEEQHLLSEVAERNERLTTRMALADIFWLGVGALLGGSGHAGERSSRSQ
ncbi:MAG: CBS domain-containing protein [Gammaproteobacteria bacterium]|nr:CBS domain-containing protein [Gammaproteobacteria bacterium]